MTGIRVNLADAFTTGDLDSYNFKDLNYLSDGQEKALSEFIDSVEAGDPLTGKNKPSWLNDDLEEIPHTSTYQDLNYWHYHCGPNYSDAKVKNLTFDLSLNLDGVTSAEVIHYAKEDDGSITIVAFSPEHVPFPLSDHPTESNPLFDVEE
ncbi:hypothetical protein [Vibrio splendidus]|uniref:hypothetical protein n=1 Tax=Vibrio splendidus TaxID=29497 RepID=UPI000D3ABC6B|nr:hypothetical protein [Vibrio splendidus]PTO72792.1 hypothetical protein CWN93_23735 [Vibrio splendidus]